MAENAYLSNQFEILPLNFQGQRDKSKCTDGSKNLKQEKNHNVYFLQDTHFTPN